MVGPCRPCLSLFAWCQVEAKVREIMKVPSVPWAFRGDLDRQRSPNWVPVPISKCSTDSAHTKRRHFVAVSCRWVGDLISETNLGSQNDFGGKRSTNMHAGKQEDYNKPKKWAWQSIQKANSASWCGENHWLHCFMGNYGVVVLPSINPPFLAKTAGPMTWRPWSFSLTSIEVPFSRWQRRPPTCCLACWKWRKWVMKE